MPPQSPHTPLLQVVEGLSSDFPSAPPSHVSTCGGDRGGGCTPWTIDCASGCCEANAKGCGGNGSSACGGATTCSNKLKAPCTRQFHGAVLRLYDGKHERGSHDNKICSRAQSVTRHPSRTIRHASSSTNAAPVQLQHLSSATRAAWGQMRPLGLMRRQLRESEVSHVTGS